MRQALKRVPVQQQARRSAKYKSFPSPTGGWVVNENVTRQREGTALVLENWFPTTQGIRVRGGCSKRATITSGDPVLSMFTYKSGATEKLFAADETNIFDLTSVADADAIPTAAVSSQTAGYYSTAAMVTTAGNYLICVNGADDAQLFDGSSWQDLNAVSTPAIAGVATADLSNAWVFANRVFFVEDGTFVAWFLPVDSIGGTAADFSLAGVFKKGGALLFGATWSLDSGDGLDDKCVFVSTEGEVAIYEGTNPASAADWRLAGVYEITTPMGMKATARAGGDLLVATEDGIVPISQAIQKDPAALSLAAVTKAIEPEWQKEVTVRRGVNWEMLKWDANNMLIVSQPVIDTQDPQCLVANLETGAWCKFTGWDVRCVALFVDNGYFGTNDGKVYQMEVGGNDDGEVYTAVYAGAFDSISSQDSLKIIKQMRTTFKSSTPFVYKSSVSIDYNVSIPSPPSSVADYSTDDWDVGEWDVALWDTGSDLTKTTTAEWHSIGRACRAISPNIQITSGVTPKPNIELVISGVTYENGGLVV